MANDIVAYLNLYSTYGWQVNGSFVNKANFTALRYLPSGVNNVNGKAVFLPNNEPFNLPPFGYSYAANNGNLSTGEQLYSLDEIAGLTPSKGSNDTTLLKNTIVASQNSVINGINTTATQITSAITGATNTLDSAILNSKIAINNLLSSSSNSILTRIASGTTTIASDINTAVSTITGKIQSNVDAVSGIEKVVSNNVFSSANNVINSIASSLGNAQTSIANTVQSSISNTQNSINNALSSSVNNLTNQLTGVKNQVDTATNRISNSNTETLEGIVNGITSSLDPLNLFTSLLHTDYASLVHNLIPDLGGDITKSIERIRNAIDKLLKGEYKTWHNFIDDLGVFEPNSTIINSVINAFLILPIMKTVFENAGNIYSQNPIKLLMAEVRPTSLQSGDILKAAQRKLISDDLANELLAKLGFSDELITILRGNNKILLDVNEVKTMFLRDMITEEEHDLRLYKLGFKDQDIQHFKQLYFAIPNPNDLVRFAVREVFTPKTVKAYGLDEDFPTDFEKYAKQVGLDTQWTHAYWQAHWELPSANMGFDMFHRGLISEQELKDLLKALDVMPYWRDKVIGISYNPITRVDIRRLYTLGLISLDDVEKRYRDDGYSPNDAKLLARFTDIDANKDDVTTEQDIKILSKSVIETAYKKKVLSRDDAFKGLSDLGYKDADVNIILAIADVSLQTETKKDVSQAQSDRAHKYIVDAYKRRSISLEEARAQLLDLDLSSDDIDTELSFADYEYQLSVKTNIINKVQDLYLSNTIDDVDLKTVLSVNGFNIKEIEQIIDELVIYKSLRDKKPTKADFDKLLKFGIITQDDYIYEMQGLGFADKYIQMYLDLVAPTDTGDE